MKTAKQIIDVACASADISKAELARRIGWSSATLSNRIKAGKSSNDESVAIANALGAEARTTITLPDGTVIG